jgi:hypothetical protein
MALSEWTDKGNTVYLHNGKLSNNKKNETLSFAVTWMESEVIELSETAYTERQTPHVLTHLWK